MATDAAAIGLALLAMWIAERAASAERTFGFYRTEILAALLNAVALWLIVAWICFEAYHRFFQEDSHVDGWPVLFVGLGGLAVNIAAAFILHRSSEHSLNAEGAFQHVMADLLGSVGVVISSVLIITMGWQVADPIISIVIGLLILVSSWGLMTSVVHVLLEGTPENIDVYKLCNDIEELDGVTLVHDVHAWTITSQSDAFTAHVLIDAGFEGSKDDLLVSMKNIAHEEFGISHVTIQMEESVKGCDEYHHVDHLAQRSRIVRERSTWGSLRFLLPGT
jgi:cobalt-zinc-cadmium efflux system protein